MPACAVHAVTPPQRRENARRIRPQTLRTTDICGTDRDDASPWLAEIVAALHCRLMRVQPDEPAAARPQPLHDGHGPHRDRTVPGAVRDRPGMNKPPAADFCSVAMRAAFTNATRHDARPGFRLGIGMPDWSSQLAPPTQLHRLCGLDAEGVAAGLREAPAS
jgi:hypothetical protein